jgi:CBS domain-containing protein
MFRMRVRDVMTPAPVTVGADVPLRDVAVLLFERGVSGVPVLDDEDRVVGVISETDLLEFEDQQTHRPERRSLVELFVHPERAARFQAMSEGVRARDVMSAPVRSVGPDVPLVEAIRTIIRLHLRRLVVLEPDGRVAGVVSLHDLLAPFLRSDDEIELELRDDIVAWVLGDTARHIRVGVDDGVVTLEGHVQHRSAARSLVRMSERVPGVTGVEDRMSWEDDDIDRGAPEHVEPAIASAERIVRLG